MKGALVDRAITKEAESYSIFTAILGGESHPDSKRNVGTNDGVTSIHVAFFIEIVHRSAQATRATGSFAKKFRHAGVRACSASESMSVITICRDEIIIWPCRANNTDNYRFLADIKMA